MHFRHVREEDGLSHNFVISFLKDSRNQVWLGTQNGLERFDGSHHYIFRRSRIQGSIPDNVIHDLCEDRQGVIWGATSDGIFSLDAARTRFRAYSTPSNRFAKAVKNILCDRTGTIWASGEWNIMRYDWQHEHFTDIPSLTATKDSLSFYAVRKNCMIEDPSGTGIWIATRMGLHFFDPIRNVYTNFRNNHSALFHPDDFSALSVTPGGRIWVFSNSRHKLLEFDPVQRLFTDSITLSNAYRDARAATSFEDHTGRVWLSTWSQGLVVLHRGTGIPEIPVKHDERNPLSIAGDFVWEFLEDSDGAVWLGTSSGLSIGNPEKELFRVHAMRDLIPGLEQATINILAENKQDLTWWMVYEGNRLIHYDPQTGRFETIDTHDVIRQADGLPYASPHWIRIYGDTVFVCTENGIWHLLPGSRTLAPYRPLPKGYMKGSLVLRDYLKMADGRVFFNGFDRLLEWNAATQTGRLFLPSRDTFPGGQKPFFDYPTLGSDGKVWFVAGFGWLGCINQNGTIQYRPASDAQNPAYNGYFTGMQKDATGRFWMANRGAGLVSFQPATGQLKNYYQSDGLITDNIHKCVPDFLGNVWTVSYNQLSVLNTQTGTFRNFKIPIYESELDYGNQLIRSDSNGHIYAAICRDVVEFYPERLRLKPAAPAVSISAVLVNGKERMLFEARPIQLQPEERSLVFKFGLLSDPIIFPARLLFKLEGFDTAYRVAGTSAAAEYPNLPQAITGLW